MAADENRGFLTRQNDDIELRRRKFALASRAFKKCVDENRKEESEAFLLDLHQAGTDYFRFVESCVLDSGGTVGAEFADWLRDITKTALSVLSATPHFYGHLREHREKLGLRKTAFEPSPGFFQNMQGLLASERPREAAKLKEEFLAAELPVDGFEQPYIPQPRGDGPVQKKMAPVIILIHGIRTEARWQKRIAPLLKENSEAVVCPVGYDFQNVFEFLLPGPTRRHAIQKILWRLDKAIDDNPGREIVIIAHSFGTYCVSEILKQHPRIKPCRVLLCGSVVDRNFRWDLLRQQPLILNECGTRDIWPPLARSSTWGYGASGTFGFKTPGVVDRYHDITHSGYFQEEFVRTFWSSFALSGEVVVAPYEQKMAEPSWWTSFLSVRWLWIPWLGWLALGLVFLIALLALQPAPNRVRTSDRTHGSALSVGGQAQVAAITIAAQQAEKRAAEQLQRVSSILLDSKSPVEQQVAALQELPEAMTTSVPVAMPDNQAPSGVRMDYNLPNLIKLRDVLRQYLKADRAKPLLASAPTEGDIGPLRVLAPASTELFHLLHRVGPPEATKPSDNLWSWLPTGHVSGIPRVRMLDEIPRPRPLLIKDEPAHLDLTHLGVRDLKGFCAPFAMLDAPGWWHTKFPRGAKLERVQLQGALLRYAEIIEAVFETAKLQRVELHGANLRRSRFHHCELQASNLDDADCRGSFFDVCRLNGATLHANFSLAALRGCNFAGARVDGDFSWAYIDGAMFGAELSGQFRGAQVNAWFAGSLLTGEMPGCDLSDSNFSGTKHRCAVFIPSSMPEPGTLAHHSHLQHYFETRSDDQTQLPLINFPGAMLSEVRGLGDEINVIYCSLPVSSTDEGEAMALISKVAGKAPPDDAEQLRDLLSRFSFSSSDEIKKTGWPPALEGYLKQVLGPESVRRATRRASVICTFASDDGEAWMDDETLRSVTDAVQSEEKESRAGKARRSRLWGSDGWFLEEIKKTSATLEKVKSPAKGVGYSDREWSFWKAYEKATQPASK